MTTTHLTVEARLGDTIDEHMNTVYAYADRGPISTFLLSGVHTAGTLLRLTTTGTNDPHTAEAEALAAERFAAWATKHAAAAREHADRLTFVGGGALCCCGAKMTWTGDADVEALAAWDAAHSTCEQVTA